MYKFQSTKKFGPYSAGIRQWKAKHSHCSLTHGYGFEFHLTFEPVDGKLDEMNWVQDFGGFKTNGLKEWMDEMFDHVLLIEKDDPYKETWDFLHAEKLAKVMYLDAMGCENLAKLVLEKFNDRLSKIEGGRVKVVRCECFEHDKNSGIYIEDNSFQSKLDKLKEEVKQTLLAEPEPDPNKEKVFAEYQSLFDFLGQPAGSELGKQVAEAAYTKGVEIGKRWISTAFYEGEILTYPHSFLVEYFKENHFNRA